MRYIIPIVFVAATVLVGCKSATQAGKTAAASANAASITKAVACTNSVVAIPVPAGPNAPAENNRLGNLAAVFIGILTIAAVRRS